MSSSRPRVSFLGRTTISPARSFLRSSALRSEALSAEVNEGKGAANETRASARTASLKIEGDRLISVGWGGDVLARWGDAERMRVRTPEPRFYSAEDGEKGRGSVWGRRWTVA